MVIKENAAIIKTSVKFIKNMENYETHFHFIFTFQCFRI